MIVPSKPAKTLADYFAIAISPVLIMLMVGSLCFFLVEVFYRGEAEASVRWVLFWFVIATVLVARIGIEQGNTHALVYGVGLAVATWLYLTRVHPAYLLGALMLGIVWLCAHQLTRDCTLMDDDADATGRGLLQMVRWRRPGEKKGPGSESNKPEISRAGKKQTSGLHSPGIWLIYFSLAALPLFGIGQTLLPAEDLAARQTGFEYLFTYLLAALGLFLTTSFLGLRRYLRQRYLPMPPEIAVGWLKFGAGLTLIVLLAAFLMPRPGVGAAWGTLRYHIDYRLRQASEYAMRFNPHGRGQGNPGQGANLPQTTGSESQNGKPQPPGDQRSPNQSADDHGPKSHGPAPKNSSPPLSGAAARLYRLLRRLLLLALAVLVGWWIFRRRDLLLQIFRELWAALVGFFKNLFSFRLAGRGAKAPKTVAPRLAFASYQNPFATGDAAAWPPQQLILYSFEALQHWAAERGIEVGPERTAREFCSMIGSGFPEVASELNHLAFLYGHAAYGTAIPRGYDQESLRKLWEFMSVAQLPAPAATA